MDFVKLLRKLFGNKSDRDMKLIQPLVEEVLKVYPEIQALSNDDLRERTKQLQAKIKEAGVPLRKQIDELKATIEATPIEERKPIFDKIDKMEKEVLANGYLPFIEHIKSVSLFPRK